MGQQQQHQENDSLLPLEKDVLCGRGGRKNINHPGNKNYRAVIQTNKPVFDQCRLRTEKRDLSIAIVASIRAGGGRFLQPRKAEDTNKVAAGTTTWCEIGDPKAVEKTLQALREKRHDTDRQHEQQTTTNDDEEEKDDAGTTTTSTTTTSDDDADVVDFVLPPIPTSSISLFQDWITRRKTLWRLKWNHLAETKKKGKKRDPLINDDSIIAVTGDTIIWTDKFSEDFPQIFKKLNTPLKLINKKYFYPNRGCRVDHAYGMKILHDFGLLEEYWTEFHKLYSKVPIPCPEDISGEITILKCKKDGRRQSVSKKDGYPAPRVVLRKKIMLSKENEIIFDFRCHVRYHSMNNFWRIYKKQSDKRNDYEKEFFDCVITKGNLEKNTDMEGSHLNHIREDVADTNNVIEPHSINVSRWEYCYRTGKCIGAGCDVAFINYRCNHNPNGHNSHCRRVNRFLCSKCDKDSNMTEQEKAEAVANSYDDDDDVDPDTESNSTFVINETTDLTTTSSTTNVAQPLELSSNVLFGDVVEDMETIVNESRLGIWCDDNLKYYPCTVVKIRKEEGMHELFVKYDDGEDECLDISYERICWIKESP